MRTRVLLTGMSGVGKSAVLDGLRERMAIVLVTHDIGVLPEHVSRVACLNQRLYIALQSRHFVHRWHQLSPTGSASAARKAWP